METARIAYKKDLYGNDILARVTWSNEDQSPKPIALMYHGGGLMVGSSEIIPQPQIDYLARRGFAVVIPNYRLAPQVTGKEAFTDCEEAYDWATSSLPEIMKTEHSVSLDGTRVAALGHSSGGSIALHLASCKPVKAITAFYPSLFTSDPSTSAHHPTTAPPFGSFPDFHPTDGDWNSITPTNHQLSEAPMAKPGTVPAGRNKWQMHVLKNGLWPQTIQPDGDYASLDALTRVSASWPPVCIVQGEVDDVPGSSLELARRAERELKAAGVREVRLDVVPGVGHMFDLPPTVGREDLGTAWKAIVGGLEWVVESV